MVIFVLIAGATLSGAVGLWMGYLWGFSACMAWLFTLTGVRLDRDGKPTAAGLRSDGGRI